MILLSLLLSFAGPLILLPAAQVLPLPYLVEEVFKLLVVIGLLKGGAESLRIPIIAGLLFTVSETMLYLSNFIFSPQIELILPRLLLTGTVHVATTVIIFVGLKRGYLTGALALVAAIGLHYTYNEVVSLLLR